MAKGPRPRAESNVQFELPKLIASIKEGWQSTGENGAVVSALLAGVAAQLLGFFKTPGSYTHASDGQQRAVVVLCYCALIFNIGGAIWSFVMIDYLGERQGIFQGLRTGYCSDTAAVQQSGCPSVSIAGVSCLFLGILALLGAVLTYVWLEEVLWSKIVVLLATAWILLAPIVLLLWPRN